MSGPRGIEREEFRRHGGLTPPPLGKRPSLDGKEKRPRRSGGRQSPVESNRGEFRRHGGLTPPRSGRIEASFSQSFTTPATITLPNLVRFNRTATGRRSQISSLVNAWSRSGRSRRGIRSSRGRVRRAIRSECPASRAKQRTESRTRVKFDPDSPSVPGAGAASGARTQTTRGGVPIDLRPTRSRIRSRSGSFPRRPATAASRSPRRSGSRRTRSTTTPVG